jgi:Fic family protein
MLLNHKSALGYLLENPVLATHITVPFIEDLHSLLIQDLGVGRNLRSRSVGVTGTAYKPLDNIYQIREALERICHLINQKTNAFEKALLAVLFISYLQPFEDGNKRTARMLGNALLIHGGMCPLSYRSVDSIDYKKAMLLFYEQNNLSAFKRLFLEQVRFSVSNYFQ